MLPVLHRLDTMDVSVTWICFIFTFTSAFSHGDPGHCPSYCDAHGAFTAEFECPGPNDSPSAEYCCGKYQSIYCCNNSSLDLSGSYPQHWGCEEATWLKYKDYACLPCSWRVMAGIMFVVMVIAAISVVCSRWSKTYSRIMAGKQDGGPLDHGCSLFSGLNEPPMPVHIEIGQQNHQTLAQCIRPPDYTVKDLPPQYEEVFECPSAAVIENNIPIHGSNSRVAGIRDSM